MAFGSPYLFPVKLQFGGFYPHVAYPIWPLGLKAGSKGKGGKKGKARVMILMSDTGGGHRASAQALKSAFEYLYGHDYQARADGLRPGRLCGPAQLPPRLPL